MQVQYGVLSTVPDVQFYNTISGSASETVSTNPTLNWKSVDSVRIWLLARSAVTEPGYLNSQTYSMGNQAYTVNDGFRRQLYTTVVQIRN
jgi:hypothetical protein